MNGRLRRMPKRSWTLIIVLIILGVAIYISNFVSIQFLLSMRSFSITGASMKPELREGQVIWASSFFYQFGKPSRGDLVIFHPPLSTASTCLILTNPDELNIKRIIGMPGDTISVTSTAVLINGSILNEPYLATDSNGVKENGMAMSSITLGPDQYFLMGDNRLISADSRCYGPVPLKNIVSKVILAVENADPNEYPTFDELDLELPAPRIALSL